MGSSSSADSTARQRPLVAFGFAVPIAVLGGLIGLGGAEFRLPVLVGPLGYAARKAVPLNLAVSLVTVAASLAIRGRALSLESLRPFRFGICAIIVGAVVAAFVGAGLAGRLSESRLRRTIFFLLIGIGALLIVEGFLPKALPALLPDHGAVRIVAGVCFGMAVGLVSSLLGVAGGELIIPTLVFAYGIDIKSAGTASLIISLPTVLVGIVRYAWRGAYADRKAITGTVVPMGIGSIIGAVTGGLLVGIVPCSVLKVGLGIILNWSAFHTFRKPRHQTPMRPLVERQPV